MNYNRTDSPAKTEKSQSSGEAELLAEILTRLDDKQKSSQMNEDQQRLTQSINLVELFYYMLTKLHIVLAGMVLGAIVMGLYAASNVVPVYSATAKLYIMGTTGSSIMADLQIGSALTMDYQEVFQTWEVHQMVNEELGTNYSYTQLQRMITVSNPDDTHILYITAQATNAELASEVANAYANAAKRFIVQVMNTDEPSVFSVALVPSVASGISITSYIIRGILLGTVLAIGILVLIFLLDNRPKSPEDIMRYANIPTLAVIPDNPMLSGTKSTRKKVGKT